MNIQPYDHADFLANPTTHAEYTTATIAVPIQSLPECKVGDVVRIEFVSVLINPGHEKTPMPLYMVSKSQKPSDDPNGAYLYACALGNFRKGDSHGV
jgi:hypothetical protein